MLGTGGKALLIWLCIFIIAIANGALREAVLTPVLGKVSGVVLSGILLSIAILSVSYFMLPWIGASTLKEYFTVGLGWLFLTIFFEFIFGHIIQGKPLSNLIEAYTFKGGNIWPIVLIVTAIAPYIAAKIRGLA